jgi:fusaric acid resistance family protein
MIPRLRRSLGRVRSAAWPVAQAALAAGIAWFLAFWVLGHAQPVFAPTAAVVALAANVGSRGRQAVKMLVGIGVGVAVGELLVLVVGTGTLQVTIAAAISMLAAAALLYSPLPLIQAGGSAVLVVALQDPESGGERVLDALVGGGVALFVSQILFAPSPASMLAEAARRTLARLSGELGAIARALDDTDAAAAGAAVKRLREEGLRSASDLAATRQTAGGVSRRTLRGRWESDRLKRLGARVGEVDLLFGDALLVARAAREFLDQRGKAPRWLCRAVDGLARAVGELAGDPESPGAARGARRFALEAAEAGRAGDSEMDPRITLAAEGVRLLAADIERMVGEEGCEAAVKDPRENAQTGA